MNVSSVDNLNEHFFFREKLMIIFMEALWHSFFMDNYCGCLLMRIQFLLKHNFMDSFTCIFLLSPSMGSCLWTLCGYFLSHTLGGYIYEDHWGNILWVVFEACHLWTIFRKFFYRWILILQYLTTDHFQGYTFNWIALWMLFDADILSSNLW